MSQTREGGRRRGREEGREEGGRRRTARHLTPPTSFSEPGRGGGGRRRGREEEREGGGEGGKEEEREGGGEGGRRRTARHLTHPTSFSEPGRRGGGRTQEEREGGGEGGREEEREGGKGESGTHCTNVQFPSSFTG